MSKKLFGVSAFTLSAAILLTPILSAHAAAPTVYPSQSTTADSTTTTITVTVTQDQINANPAITSHDPRFSNVSIVLLQGQAQVNSTYTGPDRRLPEAPRRNKTATPVPSPAPVVEQLVSIWTPVVRIDRIDWLFVSATANGQPTSSDRVRDHHFGLEGSVNDVVKTAIEAQFGAVRYRDTAVTVSPGGVVITVEVGLDRKDWTQNAATATVTQAQINANPLIKHHDPRFTDPGITLLAGQAQVNSTFTGIDPNTQSSDSAVAVVSIWTPVVRDGRIDWVFVSGTIGGKPTSADFVRDHRFGLIDSVNDEVRKSIDTQFNSRIFRDTSVTVSPDGVVVNATVWTKSSPTATPAA